MQLWSRHYTALGVSLVFNPVTKRCCQRHEQNLAGDMNENVKPVLCSFDADITLLLSVEEEEEYLARSLKAATNSCADLVPCPQANCDGVAVTGGGA